MLQIQRSPFATNCRGVSRRTALKAGFCGLLGLTMADLFRLRAAGLAPRNNKAVILLWLDGGLSQLDSYDPKPDAPSEFRGPWGALRTNVPGMLVSETLPRHVRYADKMVFLRSVSHNNGDHFAAAHWMLTGRYGSHNNDRDQKYPSVGSYVARVRGANTPGLPPYVGLPSAESIYLFPGYQGSAYLGPAYNPFDVNTQQRYLGATHAGPIDRPKCLDTLGGDSVRLRKRVDLLTGLDQFRRDLDQRGALSALDQYQQQAIDLVLNEKARAAFDIEREDARNRDRYGRGPWGHYALLARRLVEAGVSFVTVDMPHWDDHANIEVAHAAKLAVYDQAVTALIQDLADRSLLKDVLVVTMTEFGRTPKINQGLPDLKIPGRDHWGEAFSVMLAGGGLRTGQVVGATNAKAEYPVERPLSPADVLATVYQFLEIDARQTFNDPTGRPVPLLDAGHPITEIL